MLETEVVNFQTGIEGAMLLPGSIIEISDSRRFGENINGRIKEVIDDSYAVKIDKIISNLILFCKIFTSEEGCSVLLKSAFKTESPK